MYFLRGFCFHFTQISFDNFNTRANEEYFMWIGCYLWAGHWFTTISQTCLQHLWISGFGIRKTGNVHISCEIERVKFNRTAGVPPEADHTFVPLSRICNNSSWPREWPHFIRMISSAPKTWRNLYWTETKSKQSDETCSLEATARRNQMMMLSWRCRNYSNYHFLKMKFLTLNQIRSTAWNNLGSWIWRPINWQGTSIRRETFAGWPLLMELSLIKNWIDWGRSIWFAIIGRASSVRQ